eukprot:358875-Chlamydomonas_euryale.AAC.3
MCTDTTSARPYLTSPQPQMRLPATHACRPRTHGSASRTSGRSLSTHTSHPAQPQPVRPPSHTNGNLPHMPAGRGRMAQPPVQAADALRLPVRVDGCAAAVGFSARGAW